MPKRYVKIIKKDSPQILLEKVRWCNSYACRLAGLQFRRSLQLGEGLVLVYPRESIKLTSVHMFFVFLSLGIFWINEEGKVTSAQLAHPWRPYYASPEPARYVLETHPDIMEVLSPGDYIEFT